MDVYRSGIAALTVAWLVLAFPAAAMASPVKAVKPTVSLQVDSMDPEVGDTVMVTGITTHVAASRSVFVQRHTASGWHRIATANTNAIGKYATTFVASGLGKEPLRAVVSATVSHPAVVSPTRVTTVYDWFPLEDVTATKLTGMVQRGPANVLGNPTKDVLVFAPDATVLHPSATYELDGLCTDVRSNVVWDETTPGQDTLRIFVDGTQRVNTTVQKVTGVATELHQSRFVTLETDGVADVTSQRAAWLDADVRCSEDPADI